MKRIKLTRDEKQVLRLVATGRECPDTYPHSTYSAGLKGLEREMLVFVARDESHAVVDARLTDYGRQYLAENPRLHNPVSWRWIITTALTAIAACAAVAALFIACVK